MSGRPQRSPASPPGGKKGSERTWRFYVAILIAIVALVFILQNSQDVQVDLIFSTTTAPLFFILLLTFVAGAVAGWLLPKVRGRRKGDEKP
jgi:putative membrane protein